MYKHEELETKLPGRALPRPRIHFRYHHHHHHHHQKPRLQLPLRALLPFFTSSVRSKPWACISSRVSLRDLHLASSAIQWARVSAFFAASRASIWAASASARYTAMDLSAKTFDDSTSALASASRVSSSSIFLAWTDPFCLTLRSWTSADNNFVKMVSFSAARRSRVSFHRLHSARIWSTSFAATETTKG